MDGQCGAVTQTRDLYCRLVATLTIGPLLFGQNSVIYSNELIQHAIIELKPIVFRQYYFASSQH